MQNLIKIGKKTLLCCGLAASLVAVGCTPKITDEQLAKIRELRSECARLETDIKKAESDKSRLDRELASRQKELKDCEDKKSFVNEKLSKWPNVWD